MMQSIHYHNFIGQSGLFWSIGIVEDRNDPEKLGRVRVRCFGIHTEDRSLLPTEDLPFAHISLPTNNTSSIPTLKEGDAVLVMFLDGHEMQEPIILAYISSFSGGARNPQKGFTDPSLNPNGRPLEPAVYDPSTGVKDYRNSNYSTGEEKPPTGAETTSEGYENSTVAGAKKNFRLTGLPKNSETTFDEPENPFAAEYPYNKVTKTESGHIIEVDDTPFKERIHIFHRSGTFVEIHPNGDIVTKNTGKNYELTVGETLRYTQGDSVESVQGNMNVFSNGSYTLECAGPTMNITVLKGDLNLKVVGNVNEEVSGNKSITVGGNLEIDVGGVIDFNATQYRYN